MASFVMIDFKELGICINRRTDLHINLIWSLAGCVTLDKSLKPSEPQFLICKVEAMLVPN